MSKKLVIFDTDLGVDDAMALLFLHAHPQVELVGICSGAGNASTEKTTRNCLYVAQRFGIDVPVIKGEASAVDGIERLPAPASIHGENGLGDIELPTQIPGLSQTLSAADFIVQKVKQNPYEITLVTVGRLSNLALALRRAPEIASLFKQVIVMGGVVGRNGHGGNISPIAEANIFGDPQAADEIFCSDCNITMVGLDVTQDVFLEESLFKKIRDGCGEMGQFIYQISRIYTDFHRRWRSLNGCYVHDASAAVYAVMPELFQIEKGQIRVATEGVAGGQTIFSPSASEWFVEHWQDKPEHAVCVKVDGQGVLDCYFNTLYDYALRP